MISPFTGILLLPSWELMVPRLAFRDALLSCGGWRQLAHASLHNCRSNHSLFIEDLRRSFAPSLTTSLETGKRGHYERGLFTGGISRISRVYRISRISRKLSDSPLFSTVWGLSRPSRISQFSRMSQYSRVSGKWTFLKRPLFQKTPFSEPERFMLGPACT